jgi:uncharacterized iron-regulated membrane protein
VISWDHEIDEWLNGHLFDVSSRGNYLPPLELASRIEAADSRARVTWVPLQYEEGHAAQFRVQPRVDPSTGKVYELGYNSVFIDPVSGEVQGRRESGKVALDREHLMPFLYRLRPNQRWTITQSLRIAVLPETDGLAMRSRQRLAKAA